MRGRLAGVVRSQVVAGGVLITYPEQVGRKPDRVMRIRACRKSRETYEEGELRNEEEKTKLFAAFDQFLRKEWLPDTPRANIHVDPAAPLPRPPA